MHSIRQYHRWSTILKQVSYQTISRQWHRSITPKQSLSLNRTFHSTRKIQDQHLHGYKDTQRYHGKYPQRTHMCGQVNLADVDKEIVLCGWAQSSRSLSQDLIFLPIRDTTGITQLVYRAETCPAEIKTMIQDLSTESVICIKGIVRKRPEGTINPQLSTGTIEVDIQNMYCLNPASTQLPFWPSQPKLVKSS